MATPHKGRSKKNRACGVCQPHRAEGNGGTKAKYKALDKVEARSSDTYEVNL